MLERFSHGLRTFAAIVWCAIPGNNRRVGDRRSGVAAATTERATLVTRGSDRRAAYTGTVRTALVGASVTALIVGSIAGALINDNAGAKTLLANCPPNSNSPACRSVTPTIDARKSPTPTPIPTPTSTAIPPSPTPAPPTGYVTRSGASLTLNGAPYTFVGLNDYSANSDWTVNPGCGSNHAGTVLQDDLTAIGSGQRAFRAWFFQSLAVNRNTGARDWTAFDRTLSIAAASNEKVVVTLADQWNDCEGPYKDGAWYSGGYATTVQPGTTVTYRQWAAEVATRYATNPAVLMWQMVNEGEVGISPGQGCAPNAAALFRAFADDIGAVIKAADSHHLVSIGTQGPVKTCGAVGQEYANLHLSPNVDLCEFHDYGAETTAMPSDLSQALSLCAADGKPLFVGEVGVSRSVGLDARSTLLSSKASALFNAGGVGFLPWNWKDDATFSFDVGDPWLTAMLAY